MKVRIHVCSFLSGDARNDGNAETLSTAMKIEHSTAFFRIPGTQLRPSSFIADEH
jgi:hypothetical protein